VGFVYRIIVVGNRILVGRLGLEEEEVLRRKTLFKWHGLHRQTLAPVQRLLLGFQGNIKVVSADDLAFLGYGLWDLSVKQWITNGIACIRRSRRCITKVDRFGSLVILCLQIHELNRPELLVQVFKLLSREDIW